MSVASTVESLLIGTLPRREAERVAEQVAGALGTVRTVEVQGARIPVDTVHAYGLTITVDAHGRAVTVSAEAGLVVAG